MESYHIISLMSGTSLDGIDIAFVKINQQNKDQWSFELLKAETVEYSEELKENLRIATDISAPALFHLDKILGNVMGDSINHFISKNKISKKEIQIIASHGHTVFHQPEKGFTVQIGCGSTITLKTGISVVNDFRTKDVILGGQGAPLVPIGDFELFNDQAEAFLNIGGITNISFKKDGNIVAFDCSPGNLPLNKLAQNKGLSYDKNGEIARSGEINFFLLDILNNLPYYQITGPKSLGTEWLEQHFYPLVKFDRDIENNLRTIIEHEAYQIGQILNHFEIESLMITGGGAFNKFLIERIQHYYKGKVVLPAKEIIEFKEAIIFAFLGALYLKDLPNCLSEVTGASRDVCGGVLHRA
ncbi:MAG: anhydro-N-acetylmuramic acid kinase [Crocinitomicaceae bacterium]|nr:anhydro-N-acetylmuramic acid kinase [Crocinitomicaceae bacterium]